jgi:hypothetical protein
MVLTVPFDYCERIVRALQYRFLGVRALRAQADADAYADLHREITKPGLCRL